MAGRHVQRADVDALGDELLDQPGRARPGSPSSRRTPPPRRGRARSTAGASGASWSQSTTASPGCSVQARAAVVGRLDQDGAPDRRGDGGDAPGDGVVAEDQHPAPLHRLVDPRLLPLAHGAQPRVDGVPVAIPPGLLVPAGPGRGLGAAGSHGLPRLTARPARRVAADAGRPTRCTATARSSSRWWTPTACRAPSRSPSTATRSRSTRALALQHWGGRGAVRLRRSDPHRRALLLDWLPGPDLGDTWDVEACEVVGGALRPAARPGAAAAGDRRVVRRAVAARARRARPRHPDPAALRRAGAGARAATCWPTPARRWSCTATCTTPT